MSQVIHPTAVIYPRVVLGDLVWIGPYVVIGDPPGHAGYDPRSSFCGVVIGDRTVIHSHTTIQAGIRKPTFVGPDCVLMAASNVGHDCVVERRVQLMKGVGLAGSVTIGANANVGLHACVHQHRIIGARAMIGMGAAVVEDIPENALAYGVPARVRGINVVGLRRLGWTEEEINYAYLRLCQRVQRPFTGPRSV